MSARSVNFQRKVVFSSTLFLCLKNKKNFFFNLLWKLKIVKQESEQGTVQTRSHSASASVFTLWLFLSTLC